MTKSITEQFKEEQNLQYEINRLNAAMFTINGGIDTDNGYRFVLIDNGRRIAWIKKDR